MVRLLRRKSRYLVAYGSCACQGGVPGLANQFSRDELLRFVYEEAPTLGENGRAVPSSNPGTTDTPSGCRNWTMPCAHSIRS